MFYIIALLMFRKFDTLFAIVKALPSLAIMSYGAYALITIGKDVCKIEENE